MITEIKMTSQDVDEILEILPAGLKHKLSNAIRAARPSCGIDLVREFVERFEDDNDMDNLLAHTCSTMIMEITNAAKKEAKKRKINGVDVGKITIQCMKDEISRIEEALNINTSKSKHN